MRAANIAVIAIQRSQDAQARMDAEHQRSLLLADLITAEEDERRRIARELHDGTGQTLTSLLLRLRALQYSESLDKVLVETEQLRQSTADVMADLRRISQGLYPTVLDDFGLVPAIRRCANEAAKSGNFEVEISDTGMADVRLSRSVETALYRMTQEALNNIQKHAQAKHVFLSITLDPEWLSIIVKDDGKGFDKDEQKTIVSEESKLGLFSMRQRSAWLGGSLEVTSHQGEGAMVSIRIPAMELITHD
jgi:signal transduction histidine kinase